MAYQNICRAKLRAKLDQLENVKQSRKRNTYAEKKAKPPIFSGMQYNFFPET